jgi:hypothetical protein
MTTFLFPADSHRVTNQSRMLQEREGRIYIIRREASSPLMTKLIYELNADHGQPVVRLPRNGNQLQQQHQADNDHDNDNQ